MRAPDDIASHQIIGWCNVDKFDPYTYLIFHHLHNWYVIESCYNILGASLRLSPKSKEFNKICYLHNKMQEDVRYFFHLSFKSF